jgi:hypothetical protein
MWGGRNRPYAFTHVTLDEFGRSGSMGCLLSLALQSEFSTPHLARYGAEALQRRLLPSRDRWYEIIKVPRRIRFATQ